MEFQQYDLGQVQAGRIVEVTLGYAANVKIMDSFNFSSYKRGGAHRFIGGYVTESPYKASIPNSGHWYVTIDLGGHAGKISSSVQVLPV